MKFDEFHLVVLEMYSPFIIHLIITQIWILDTSVQTNTIFTI